MAQKDDSSRGLNGLIEKHLMPIAVKLGGYKWLVAIRDGIAVAMPLIIVGSFFMILNSFPVSQFTAFLANTKFNDVSIAQIFAKITNGSFGLLGVIGAFGIADSYAKQYHTDGKSAGIIAVASFFVVTPSIFTGGKAPLEGMPYDYLGSKGLFIGIIIGLVSGWVFQWFINKDIRIKMPEAVPPAISDSFSALIPGAVIVVFWGAIYALFAFAGWGSVHDVFLHIFSKPLSLLGDTIGGTLVAIALNSIFWFVGIHGGNVINTVFSPIWLINAGANQKLTQAHQLSLSHGAHIITQPFMDNFVYMGGGGATLGLVLGIGILVLMHRSSRQLAVLAPLTIAPGIFNINEPTMFGLPVVLNTTLIIPFILAPMVNALTTWGSMRLGWVPLTTGAIATWTMPPIISGFLVTSSVAGSILQAVNIVIDVGIYLPFLLNLNKQQIVEENGEDAKKAAAAKK
ncbi:PTS sugar transporter subunit IIC [Schleiferilactobacillus shenzhenensis]|uniref:Permease IIC component n=1 Tax=Schleiferilactobacillus shenzhenensis LY-73 TaxID=1231336 RepID=U4TNT2_9LACO|nr:PTS sugar transporter subunit IIC [Schleiferilactobacillus shenzhenensis]ERL65105.1 hypothetical protein L248_3043 [Schleiferilactobacillus shenzhenensis LY-73]